MASRKKVPSTRSYLFCCFKILILLCFVGANMMFHFQSLNVDTEQIDVSSISSQMLSGQLIDSTSKATTLNTSIDKDENNGVLLDENGIESQYAEVEWVRGIQDRRKLGLEPSPEDPYSDIPDHQLLLPNHLIRYRAGSVSSSLSSVSLQHNLNPILYSPWKVGSSNNLHMLEMHFVHVPKAGGTSVTKVLRRMACSLNNGTEETLDCCKNPGFCGAPEHRTCSVIKGCINHFPKLSLNFNPQVRPSLTILRQPINRAISSWHYRCHNPNFDCYKIRLGLRTWKQHLNNEVLPKGVRNFTFDEFISMPEYHNIETRMFSKDIFPYGERKKNQKTGEFATEAIGVHLSEIDRNRAVDVLDRFAWVGVMELMGTSLLLLSATLGIELERMDFVRQRASHSKLYTDFTHYMLKSSRPKAVKRRQLIIEANSYDTEIWNKFRNKQCEHLKLLNLLEHEIVKRDVERSHFSSCFDST